MANETNDIDLLINRTKWADKTANAFKAERILRLATFENGCLISHYRPSPVGYPKINGTTYVHRFICSVIKGPIPEGMYVMHSCDNKRCIHPNHISIGTAAQNNQDKINKGFQGNVGGKKPRAFSDEDRDEMKRQYATGISQREIAANFETSQGVIWRYIHDTHKEKDHV